MSASIVTCAIPKFINKPEIKHEIGLQLMHKHENCKMKDTTSKFCINYITYNAVTGSQVAQRASGNMIAGCTAGCHLSHAADAHKIKITIT